MKTHNAMDNSTKSTKHDVLIEARRLKKSFKHGDREITIVEDVSLDMAAGEIVGMIGASGSGKSTILHLLAGFCKPDAGFVKIDGVEISNLGSNAQSTLRNKHIGFVYQFHHLLPELNATENVALPLLVGGQDAKSSEERAMEVLSYVHVDHRAHHKPSELSGGERQRVAIARAIVTHPLVVFANEPTGNLDETTTNDVVELISSLSQSLNIGFLIATHDISVASTTDRLLKVTNGTLLQDRV